MKQVLLPEWAQIEAVILAWPNQDSDWAPWLVQVRKVYISLINALNKNNVPVILLVSPTDITLVKKLLSPDQMVLLIEANFNDTWVRDYAFLSCDTESGVTPIEFSFNGWGDKFNAKNDNLVNKNHLASLCNKPLHSVDLIAEGGALEIDDKGNLLSTASCLFNPLRNNDMNEVQYRTLFQQYLGCNSFTVFKHGHLQGDDTDGHIDTLVRFTPHKGLVVQTSDNRPNDTHFDQLNKLADECKAHFPEHTIYRLPLPYIQNDDGERLPASYANFLIANNTVLAPIYSQEEDEEALAVLQLAYPKYEIIPINCQPLIQQFGSLHCITMQVPVGMLKHEVIAQLQRGVSIYDN